MNRYDHELHRYFIDDEQVLSVTQILNKTGLSRDYSFLNDINLQDANSRGISIHRHCELYENDELSKYETDPKSMVCVEQWKELRQKIIKKHGEPNEICVEKNLYSIKKRFAGTSDIYFLYRTIRPFFVVVDWKTGVDSQAGELQLCGYSDLIAENIDFKPCHIYRYIAYLWYDKPNGKLKQCNDQMDFVYWNSAYNICQYLKNRG